MQQRRFIFFVRIFRIGMVTWMALLLLSGLATAQEIETPVAPQSVATPTPPESLSLPEVVITGIDRSKIQRMIPKVELAPELLVVEDALRDRSEALVQQGDVALLRQPRQAEELYLQALAIDPGNSTAYVRLGDTYRVQNKYVDAVEAYQQALTLNADLMEVHFQLGMLYEDDLQDLPKAVEQYQTYVELGGADPRTKIWIRNITRQLAGDTEDTPIE
jgi:tetratricopeptide (TPR) repeat protein